MSKKEIPTREQKAPKQVSVKSLVVGVVMFAAIVTSFIGGWFTHINYESGVRQEAAALVKKLEMSK